MNGHSPPLIPSNILANQPYNSYFQQNYQNQFSQSLMIHGNQSPSGQYFNEQTPSPLVTELVRQFLFQRTDAQYQRELLEPYR